MAKLYLLCLFLALAISLGTSKLLNKHSDKLGETITVDVDINTNETLEDCGQAAEQETDLIQAIFMVSKDTAGVCILVTPASSGHDLPKSYYDNLISEFPNNLDETITVDVDVNVNETLEDCGQAAEQATNLIHVSYSVTDPAAGVGVCSVVTPASSKKPKKFHHHH